MAELDDRADAERRLALMIIDNRSGQALAQAVPHLRNAAELWAQANRPVRWAECLIDLGRVQRRLGDHPAAAGSFAAALGMVEDESDLSLAITAASEAGLAWLAARDPVSALRLLGRAETLADKANDHLKLAQVRLDLAHCHLVRKDLVSAEATARQALATFTSFRRGQQRAACLERLAEIASASGDHERAATLSRDALAILDELARGADADDLLERWADRERDAGRFDQAVSVDQQRLARNEALGNQGLLARTLRHLGMVHAKRGAADEALAAFQRSAELSARSGDRAGEGRSRYLIGAALVRAGDAVKGRWHLECALELAREAGSLPDQEQALASLAHLQRQGGDALSALSSMQRWAEVLRQMGDREHAIKVHGEMVEVGRATGDNAKLEQTLRELIQACAEPGHVRQLAAAHHDLGVLLMHRGEKADGLHHLQHAVDITTGEPPAVRAAMRHRLGHALVRAHQPADAMVHLDRALADLTQATDEQLRARVLVDIANCKALLGQVDAAQDLFEEAAKVCEAQGDVRATQIIRRGAQGLKR